MMAGIVRCHRALISFVECFSGEMFTWESVSERRLELSQEGEQEQSDLQARDDS